MARPRRMLTHKGESLSIGAWARRLGLSPKTLWKRLHAQWTIAATLDTPGADRGQSRGCLADGLLSAEDTTHNDAGELALWAAVLHQARLDARHAGAVGAEARAFLADRERLAIYCTLLGWDVDWVMAQWQKED